MVIRDLTTKFPGRKALAIESIHLHLSFKEQGFQTKAYLLPALLALEMISSQKGSVHFSQRGAAHLQLRKGEVSAISTKLRGKKAYDFLERLLVLLLPNLKGFQGFSLDSFDQKGNLHFRLENLLLFPEIEAEYRKFQRTSSSLPQQGRKAFLPLDVSIHTTATNPQEGKVLLSALQFPFF